MVTKYLQADASNICR